MYHIQITSPPTSTSTRPHLDGAEVEGLEDVAVELHGLVRLEGVAHLDEGVRQTLHADADGAVVGEVDAVGLDGSANVE